MSSSFDEMLRLIERETRPLINNKKLTYIKEIIVGDENSRGGCGIWMKDEIKDMYYFFYYLPRDGEINCYVSCDSQEPTIPLSGVWVAYRAAVRGNQQRLDPAKAYEISKKYYEKYGEFGSPTSQDQLSEIVSEIEGGYEKIAAYFNR